MYSTINSADTFLYLLLVIPFFTSMLSFGCIFFVNAKRSVVNLINITGVTVLLITAIATLCEIYYNGQIFGAGKWLYLDSLSGLFLLTLSVLAFITGLYSCGYMNEELKEGKISEKGLCSYFGFFHLFLFSMLIVITTNNLILMWAGIEATTLSSVFLVGFYGKKSSLEAAWKYIIICTVGVAFGLYGVVLVYSSAVQSMITAGVDPSGAAFWTTIMEHRVVFDQPLMHIAFVFIVIGFGTKSGLFPMHAWLPDAHSESPSPASALLSAVLLKCAFLVILRYYIVINRSIDSTLSQNLLLAFGLGSMAIAALFFLMQKDLKRKLAYSSVENMGIIAVGVGFGGPVGVFAALIHVLNHSLVKGLLFCISGNVLLKYHTRDIRQVKGMLKVMPLSGILLAAGALGLAGLPPFNIFISEFLIVLAGIESAHPILVFIMLMILMVVLAGLVTLVANCLFGQAPKEIAKGDLGIMTLLPTSILLILMVIMGTCIPKPVTKMLASATAIVLDGKDKVSLAHIKPDLHSLLLPSNIETRQIAQPMPSEEKK